MNKISTQDALTRIGQLQCEMVAPIAVKCPEPLIDDERASSVPRNQSVQCESQCQRYPELLATREELEIASRSVGRVCVAASHVRCVYDCHILSVSPTACLID